MTNETTNYSENYSKEHEPWKYTVNVKCGRCGSEETYNLSIDSSPPKRTWVGLTDEDKQIAFDDTQEGGGFWEFADAIETKLKEKNA